MPSAYGVLAPSWGPVSLRATGGQFSFVSFSRNASGVTARLLLRVINILIVLSSLPVVRCENPKVKNGKKLSGFGTEHTYKNTVIFECDPGHVLNGSGVVTCEADNTWKPRLPTCDPSEYKQIYFLQQLRCSRSKGCWADWLPKLVPLQSTLAWVLGVPARGSYIPRQLYI